MGKVADCILSSQLKHDDLQIYTIMNELYQNEVRRVIGRDLSCEKARKKRIEIAYPLFIIMIPVKNRGSVLWCFDQLHPEQKSDVCPLPQAVFEV